MIDLALPPSGRWAVYATYDAEGRRRSHAIDQIRAYRALGFEVLVVDSSPTPSDDRVRAWANAASAWFGRVNEGYDFASYRAGLRWLADRGIALEQAALLLTNDSCFGPYTPIGDVVARFDTEDAGQPIVWGVTDSREQRRHHLQSYWLYFRPNVVAHALAFFFDAGRPVARDRDEAIWFGELAFSEFLIGRGCRLRAWCSLTDTLAHYARFRARGPAIAELALRIVANRPKYGHRADRACLLALLGHPRAASALHNQTLAFGLRLHAEGRVPFVKQALLRDNQLRDPMIPSGLEVSTLDNASAARLVESLLARGGVSAARGGVAR